MTFEEFELLARKPGWKYEYWHGKAHISPRHRAVFVRMDVTPRDLEFHGPIRSVTEGDAGELISAYVEAFEDSMEYCDYEPEGIAESARKNIPDFFAGRRGETLPASCVAVDTSREGGVIAGGALLVRTPEGTPLLDMLFVRPRIQRRGVARALVSRAVNELHRSGERVLESTYMLGNDSSQAWHRKFGFIEEPDLHLVELYYQMAEHELSRREGVGDLAAADRRSLEAEIAKWQARVEELERVRDEQGFEAVSPALRRR